MISIRKQNRNSLKQRHISKTRVPKLGQQFISELEQNKDLLRDWPELGAQIDDTFRRLVFRRFPYSLIYALEPGAIWVVAVAHDRRMPDYWRDRHSE